MLADLEAASHGPELRSAFEHRLARALHMQGRLDEAVRWARASWAHGSEQRDVLEKLPSCIELGHVLADRRRPDDLREADEALVRAREIVTATGTVIYEPRREAARSAAARAA